MPDYTTIEKVRNIVTTLASATAVTSFIIAEQINQWEGHMNVRLATRYTVPISLGAIADAALEDIATAGAAYYTLMRAPGGEDPERGEWLNRFRDRANDLLEMLVTGSATLVASGTLEAGQTFWSDSMNYVPIFGKHLSLERTRLDPDRVQDELDKRD